MKPRTLSIDIETFSSVDLVQCGVYRYAESDDFDVLLFGYSLDYGPVRVIDSAQGGVIPAEIVDYVFDPAVEKTAFNANFERTCLSKYFRRYCEPEQWSCTMVLAASCGLPMTLAGVGKALELPEDKAKMKEGKDLIKYFCQPCKPAKVNGQRTRNLPEHAPEKWEVFKAYNVRDVEVENTIRKMLLKWRPGRTEHKLWCLDQRMNDKGVRIEPLLAENAIKIGNAYREELIEQAKVLSGLENPNSTAQIKQWLEEQEGVEVLSLNKKAIADVYADLSTEETKEVLRLREEFSKSSTKKYEKFLLVKCQDDHIRGLFQFYGANKTGRFSGKLCQLQNLPHDTLPDLDTARDMALIGDPIDFECLYPKVQSALSALIRTTLIPEENSRFIVADFSAIEARVIAWIAKEQWRVDAFQNGVDIYCESASRAFKVPVVKHGINGELRATGKVLELSCIAEGQLVTTSCGLVPIQNVTKDMLVWDGDDWVEHDGVIYQGEREVIEYEGLIATEDHLVYAENTEAPIPFGVAAENGLYLRQARPNWGKTRNAGNSYKRSEKAWTGSVCSCFLRRLRSKIVDAFVRLSGQAKIPRLLLLHRKSSSAEVDCGSVQSCKTTVRESKRCGIPQLWRAWNKVLFFWPGRSRGLHGGDLRDTRSKIGFRQDRQQWGLRSRESSLGDEKSKLEKSAQDSFNLVGSEVLAIRDSCGEQDALGRKDKGRDNRTREALCRKQELSLAGNKRTARVYDIRNAGRHHRYTVSGKLVHNCGYGGSVGAMKNFGAGKMGMTEEEMIDLVDKWREASPHIVALWKSLENSAIKCLTQKRSAVSSIGSIRFDLEDGVMWMTLPSGRRIAYWGADIGKDRWGRPSLTYMTLNQTTKKWERTETFGGKLTENCVSGMAFVLTDSGFVRLKDLSLDSKVWDGEEFVSHEGCVCKGLQTCVAVDGVAMTPDHWVMTEGGWVNAADCGGLDRISIRLPNGVMSGGRGIGRFTVDTSRRYELVYDIVNCGHRHRFVVFSNAGPMVVHNCVQATARDCLKEALFNLDKAGYDVRATIHDEVIITAPNGFGSLEEVIQLMCKGAPWMEGLPLNAAGFVSKYYRKDD